VPGGAARRVAAVAEMADGWLARQVRDNGLSLEIPPFAGQALLHPHCHQKALVGGKGSADALKLVSGLDVSVLDAGCCGMAGAFGYERQHYDISVRIANLELVPAVNANPSATVVATGTSCRHQIRDLTGRAALHPLEVLAGSV
jgi:Fe-S oxidoreductase